jgi:hypothetical protein
MSPKANINIIETIAPTIKITNSRQAFTFRRQSKQYWAESSSNTGEALGP